MTARNSLLPIMVILCLLSCVSCATTGGKSSPKSPHTEGGIQYHSPSPQSESPGEEYGEAEWNELSLAISEGSREKVKAILDSRPDYLKKKDETGLTILHYAAISNQSDVALYLIGLAPDINAQNDTAMTPLHFAAKKGHLEMTRVLLDHHAFINVIDNAGKTPLDYALEGNFRDIVDLLKERHGKIQGSSSTLSGSRIAPPPTSASLTTAASSSFSSIFRERVSATAMPAASPITMEVACTRAEA